MASILGPGIAQSPPMGGLVERYAPALAAALAVVGILVVHFGTVESIVAIWRRSETFAHGFVVVPICLWLLWRKRRELEATAAKPWYPAFAIVALSGLVWLVMSIGDVIGVRQFALAFMLQAAIVGVAGLAVARVAAFPLAFLLFAVPAGEFLLPTLIDRTADFTVAALRLSGVPVYREANHFIIPSGAWSVVEACSGLRYLIASVMIGVIYGAVAYRSAGRRAAFIAASVLVPIVANWLRAYMIVMIGHLSDNRLAVGVDHLIYGWLFFGVVMGLLFWVGSFWSEPPLEAPVANVLPKPGDRQVPVSRFFAAALVAIAVAGVWRPLFAAIERPPSVGAAVIAPLAASGGFTSVQADALPEWTPNYGGHSTTLRQVFARNDVPVALYIAYYRDQKKGSELVTSANELVMPHEKRWIEHGRDRVDLKFDSRDVEAIRASIADQRDQLTAYRLFWVDGSVTGSAYVAKALLAWARLNGRSGDAALVVTYARASATTDVALEAMRALSPEILRALAATEGRR